MSKREKIMLVLGFFITVAISSTITTAIITPRVSEAYDSDLEWRVTDLESKVNDLERKRDDLEWRVDDLEY